MAYADAITSFGSGTFTVKRQTAGTYTAGVYTAGSSTNITVAAHVQPVAGADLKNMPEAQHADEVLSMYTKTELKIRTATSEPDEVTFASAQWEVVKLEKWTAFGSTYYRAFIARRATP